MSLLEDIKKLLGSKNEDFNSEGAETPTETPTADADNTDTDFVEVKTTDDLILRVEGEIAEGKNIEQVDESGANALDNGTYILEDGTELDVEESIIVAIRTVEEDPADNEDNSDKDTDTDKDDKETFSKEDILNSFNLLIKEFSEIKENHSKMEEKFNTKMTSMDEEFTKFKGEPSTDPISTDKNSKEWGTLYNKFGKFRK